MKSAPRSTSARHSRVLVALTVIVRVLTAAGCSRPSAATETTRQERVGVCAKEGDRCEFAPGKIGLCTAKEGSTALTCVSLH
jgi:putative hemolysin